MKREIYESKTDNGCFWGGDLWSRVRRRQTVVHRSDVLRTQPGDTWKRIRSMRKSSMCGGSPYLSLTAQCACHCVLQGRGSACEIFHRRMSDQLLAHVSVLDICTPMTPDPYCMYDVCMLKVRTSTYSFLHVDISRSDLYD